MLGDDAGGELLGGHFQREEADDAAVHGLQRSVGPLLRLVGLGDVEADIGDERGLAHGRAAGEDDEVGGLQPAHHPVEIDQPRRDARQLAFALIRLSRHVDGRGQRVGEALEAAVVAPGLGEREQFALGLFDLLARRGFDGGVEGRVDHVLADGDQLPAGGEVGDGAPVIQRVDDRRRLRGEAGEILRDREAAEIGVPEIGLQRDRGRDLARLDQARRDLVDAPVQILVEVLREQEIRDAVIGLVVDEHRADQSLLGFDVARRESIGAVLIVQMRHEG